MNDSSPAPRWTVTLPLVLVLSMPVGSLAAGQDASDWCREVGDPGHCEIRELTARSLEGRLTLDASPNGGIQVEPWQGGEVEVVARVTAWARSTEEAEALAREVDVRVEPGRLTSEGPRTRGRGESWQVSYRLRVPADTDLDLRTQNGGIDVREVGGAVEARTINGGIGLEDLSGPVRVETTNGGIRMSFSGATPLAHDTELRTINGAVTVRLPEGVSARLEASTRNGSIDTAFPLTVQGRIGRSVSGTLGAGGPEIRLRTMNGPIRIERN